MNNILVVDDHPSIRRYAIRLLRDEFKDTVFHESDSEDDAWRIFSETTIDAVILDLILKEGNGFSLVYKIRENSPMIPILINTMHENPDCLHRAIQLNVNGYISKRDEPDCLLTALRNIEKGIPFFSESILPLLVQGFKNETNHRVEDPLNRLSNREMEVFALLGQELSISDIAKQLVISKHTVETHIERIRRKLHIESSKKLEYYAIRIANQSLFQSNNS